MPPRVITRGMMKGAMELIKDIPDEILSAVFEETDCSRANSNEAPLLLLQVCRRWKRVALSTPTLWSTLYAFDNQPYDKVVEFLHRSKTLPLTLSPRRLTETTAKVLTKYSSRLQWVNMHYLACDFSFPTLLPLLRSFSAGVIMVIEDGIVQDIPKFSFSFRHAFYAPNLTEIRITGTSMEIIMRMIRGAPSLVDASFRCIEGLTNDTPPVPDPLTHACIKRLTLYTTGDVGDLEPCIQAMTLPSLRSLSIGVAMVDNNESTFMLSLVDLLKRSKTSLKHVSLECPSTQEELLDFLSWNSDSLTELGLHSIFASFSYTLFRDLTLGQTSILPFCPHLRAIKISPYISTPDGHIPPGVLPDMLASRPLLGKDGDPDDLWTCSRGARIVLTNCILSREDWDRVYDLAHLWQGEASRLWAFIDRNISMS